MDFILQVCKVEEKDLVHHCDVGKSFKYFVNSCSLQGRLSKQMFCMLILFKNGLLKPLYFYNYLNKMVFVSVLVPKWYLKL